MSRFHSYLGSALQVIDAYQKGKPFAGHLKSFFAADKKYGSKDRKSISSLCYCYFRTGKALMNVPAQEKILAGLFLVEKKKNEILDFFRPDLNEKTGSSISEKLTLLGIRDKDIFEFVEELGDNIDPAGYVHSLLQQPKIFLRCRPGKLQLVTRKLTDAGIDFNLTGEAGIQLEPGTAADKHIMLNREAVVQDINSQKVLDLLLQHQELSSNIKIPAWDCCAASGGKSILLFDRLKGNVQLTVSDIRENILVNLRKRLQEAAINLNRSFAADLTRGTGLAAGEKFRIILCDVPCTGSGTWSRTPEQLFSFERQIIGDYAQRQQQIVSHAIPHLDVGGLFFYITCSVFRKENEEITDFIQKKFHLQLLRMEYLEGYDISADTMFVSVFKKS